MCVWNSVPNISGSVRRTSQRLAPRKGIINRVHLRNVNEKCAIHSWPPGPSEVYLCA